MTQNLTIQTATAYVSNFITNECGYPGFQVVGVLVSPEIPDDLAFDVDFKYEGGSGVMTVWMESNGQLYGEW